MKNLLKPIFVLLILLTTVYADTLNECKTDIYFGNGVWNSITSTEDSIIELQFIIDKEIIKGDSKLQAKYGSVKLAYNWGQGTMLDVLETYYQLKEAGQVSDYQFHAVIAILTRGNPALTIGAIASQELMEPFTKNWEQGNVDEMWEKYYNQSFKHSHKVLLVSHSQGNMFANRIFNNIAPTQYQSYFANLQVASPASQVNAPKGDYVTLSTDATSFDPIINPIPGSMSPNASGESGHSFVPAYLSQADPLAKIIIKMKALLLNLDSEFSQWQTDEEFDKDTMNYRITVKHQFDASVIMDEQVYPFAPAKKLYQVGGEYVKASCGGEQILATWEDQKDNEFYLLKGTNEKISINDSFSFIAEYYFDIAGSGKYYQAGRSASKIVAPESSCTFWESGGGYIDIRNLQSDSIYLSKTLDYHRGIYERGFYIDFPNIWESTFSAGIICFAEEKGYELVDYNSIERGSEKRYIIENHRDDVRRFVLEQEYILKL